MVAAPFSRKNLHFRSARNILVFLLFQERKVLLLYPIMRTGNKVCRAMQVLIDHKVPEDHVILINLFCTPNAAKRIVQTFPNLNVLTSELHDVTPNHFGEKYFGTEHSEY